jgi:hypothetical protein
MTTPFGNKKVPAPMPGFVKAALVKAKMMDAYRERPEYQRNDYLSWINRAVGNVAKQKRLAQMLEELGKGNVYMEAEWHPPAPVEPAKKS